MPEEGNWTHYLAYGIQVFEMSSMFVLFLHFYANAYRKKPKNEEVESSASVDSENGSDAMAEQASVSSASSDEQSS